jgi:hypothetical protein
MSSSSDAGPVTPPSMSGAGGSRRAVCHRSSYESETDDDGAGVDVDADDEGEQDPFCSPVAGRRRPRSPFPKLD